MAFRLASVTLFSVIALAASRVITVLAPTCWACDVMAAKLANNDVSTWMTVADAGARREVRNGVEPKPRVEHERVVASRSREHVVSVHLPLR